MDELNKLYSTLNKKGLYTKTFDEFKTQWDDPDYRDKVYSEVSRRGLYTKDRSSFDQKYGSAVKKKEPTTSPSVSDVTSTGSDIPKQEAWQGLGASESFGAEIAKAHDKPIKDRRPKIYKGYPGKEGYEYKLVNGSWQFRKNLSASSGKDNIFDVFSSSPSYTPWQQITDSKRQVALDAHFLDGNSLTRIASREELQSRGEMPSKKVEQPSPEDYYLTDFSGKDAFTGMRDLSAQKQVAQQNLDGLMAQKELDLAAARTEDQKAQVEAQYAPLQKQATGKVDEIKNAEIAMKDGFAKLLQQPEPSVYDKKKGILMHAINKDLIALPEELVVPALVGLFENAGPEFDIFDFEESGIGNYVVARNKRSGETIKIETFNNVDKRRNALEANMLTGWVQLALQSGDYYDALDNVNNIQKDIDALPEWDSVSKMELQKQLAQARIDLKIAEKDRNEMALSNPFMAAAAYGSYKKQEISGNIFRAQEDSEKLKNDVDDANKWYQAAVENYQNGNISEYEWNEKWQPEIDEKMSEFAKRQEALQADIKYISEKQSTLEEMVGLRTVALKDRGNTLSGMSKSFTQGAVTVAEFMSGTRIGQRPGGMEETNINPYGWYFGITSNEYLKSEDRTGLQQLLFGLSKSIGASTFGSFATGGMPVGSYIGMYALSYRDMQDQIDELVSQGVDISDGEKLMLSTIYGVSIGMLEKYGISKSFSKSPIGKNFLNWMLVSTFKELPKGASADMIEEYMKKNIKAAFEKKILNFIGSGFVEGSTEGAQEMADATIKKTYNLLKDKEIFQEYDTWEDFAASVGSAAGWGMLGGHMMNLAGGSGRILKSGIKDSGMLDIETDLFMTSLADPEFKSMFSDNIKIKVANGEMTQQEGEQALQDYNRAVGLMRQIPPTSSKDVALASYDLLIEKHNLESEIAGKDPALTTEKTDRIKAIDEQLQAISNPQQNDQENIQGVPSEEQVGEKPVETKPVEKPSGETTEAGRENQSPETWLVFDLSAAVTDGKIISSIDDAGNIEETVITIDDLDLSRDRLKKKAKSGTLTKEDLISSPWGKVLSTSDLSAAVDYFNGNPDRIDSVFDSVKEKTSGETTEAGGDVQAQEEVAPVAEKTEPAAEEAVPNYNDAVSAAVDKFNLSQKRGSSKEAALESALGDLQKNDWYKNADDVAREKAYREVREKAGFKEKKAPSTKKLSGVKDKTVTVNERTALRDQIVLEARAARDAAKSEKKARKDVARKILPMFGNYKMSSRQSKSIMRAALTSNLSNPVMADRFVDYAQKVLADAEYDDKLKKATLHKKHVSAFSRSKEQLPEMRGVLRDFAAINPRYITNIDEYIEMAEKAKSAARSTRKVPGGLQIRNTGVVPEVAEYTKKTLEKQEIIEKNRLQEEHPELFAQGVLSPDMSVNEMHEIIKSIGSDGGPRISNDADITKRARQVFESYAGIMKETLDTGVDPMSGDKVSLTAAQKRGAQALLDIDIAAVDQKTLFNLIDSIGSLVNNGFVGNIDAITSYVQGGQNANKFVMENGRAPKMSYALRTYDHYFASLPVLMDTALRGTKRAISFMDLSGLSGIIRGANTAKKNAQDTLGKYATEFYKKKPNGKKFNDPANVYERGALALLSRNIVGTQGEMQSEFERRVRIINETVDYLNSNRASGKEKKKGKHYVELQQKLGLTEDGLTLDKVLEKAAPENAKAVEWWINKWGEIYDDLSEVSKTVYNKELPTDINYTPDRFKRREGAESQDIADMLEGAFGEYNDSIYNKESSVLMESKKPNILPKNRYIDLDFDANNFSMMEAAMIDTATAADIRKVQGFMQSDSFGEMFAAEDKKVISDRINNYILRVRKKEASRADQAKVFKQITNAAARVGTTMALGGVDQIPKQTISVAMNTLINSGRFDLRNVFHKDVDEWINNSGMPIASRGIQAEANIDVAEKNLDRMISKGQKAYDQFAKVNDLWLKIFLTAPDKFIARASFLSYYKQNLRSRKMSTDIDYSAPMDPEAANYAQHMLDRQQNISDSDLAGELFASKSPGTDFLRKVFFPFSNFVMNQKVRMWSDIRTASSQTATEEDRVSAYRSLLGLGAEMAMFHMVAMTLRSLYKEAAREFVDYDPERDDKDVNKAVEEENKARELQDKTEMKEEEERVFRYEFVRDRESKRNRGTFFTSVFKDIFSPVPAMDDYMVDGFNFIAKEIQKESARNSSEANEAVRIANLAREDSGKKKMNSLQEQKFREQFANKEMFQLDSFEDKGMNWGVIGIAADKWGQYRDLSEAASEGTITVQTPGGETQKMLTDKDKKATEIAAWGMLMYNLGVVPADIGKESNYIFSTLKKKALTEAQMEQYEALKKMRDGKEPSAEEMARIRNGVKADDIEEVNVGTERVEVGRSEQGRVEVERVEK